MPFVAIAYAPNLPNLNFIKKGHMVHNCSTKGFQQLIMLLLQQRKCTLSLQEDQHKITTFKGNVTRVTSAIYVSQESIMYFI